MNSWSLRPTVVDAFGASAMTNRGFTLIEVLVALVVVTIGLTAVVQSVARSVNDTTALREKTFATWIATNVIAEYQVTDRWETGQFRDERRFAGSDWPVGIRIRPAEIEALGNGIRRIEVTVYAPGNRQRSVSVVDGRLKRPETSR